MFQHILVPLDGSLLAERAIAHAEQFARVCGGNITLLQVLDPSTYREGSTGVEPLEWQIRKAETEMYLQGVAEKIREKGLSAEHVLREGRTAENIIDYAQHEEIDLVVLTTHGASGLSRWNTSSVVSKVLEKIYLPVLLVRSYQETRDAEPVTGGWSRGEEQTIAATGSQAAETSQLNNPQQENIPSFLYKRILVPIDTSRRAECSLPAAATLMEGNLEDQVTIILGAVINPPDLPVPQPYPVELYQLIDRFMEISRASVLSYMNDLSDRLPGKTETRIVQNDNISTSLHQLADQENVDLVVLCAHGQTGGTSWPYGSVARNYLEHGNKTVLVIQDVPLSQVRPTAAETAVEKYGRR